MEDKLLPLKRSKLLMDEDGEVVRLMSEKAPAHCILKIDSFSELEDAYVSRLNKDYLESTEFSVGGYTWMLSVCPKRNEPEQGDEHLSVYVTLVDKLEPGCFVDVVLRFFVYDQLRDAYLSVLDVRERRFHALKDTWGVPKFLPISTFNDADYGFLVDDCCVFGAEVLVINNQVKISTMSIVKGRVVHVMGYTWRVERLSLLTDRLNSPTFCFNGWFWKLVLYPRGQSNAKGKHLSLFLRLDNSSGLTHGKKLYARFILYLKNQREGNDHQIPGRSWYSSSDGCGFSTFLSLCDLHDDSKSYLVDDTIIIEVHIQKMILLKDNMASVKQE